MQISIVHMSDIHIAAIDDPVIDKIEQIISVLNKHAAISNHIFLVVSGDIAQSGEALQYEIADMFLDTICKSVSENCSVDISIVAIPGNHDCDFTSRNAVRDAIIKTIKEGRSEDIDPDLVKICTSVQDNFFQFRDNVCGPPKVQDRLWYQYEFSIDGHCILFDCLNIAWVSEKDEVQGELVFPFSKYEKQIGDQADFRLVALHHPSHWLSQNQYRGVRGKLRKIADLIFTGHEHVEGASKIEDADNGESLLIEAGALQLRGKPNHSFFNVIDANLSDKVFRYSGYKYDGSKFVEVEKDNSWKSFKPLPKKSVNEFEISDTHHGWLTDPGANFSHRAKPRLNLHDFFIYPDLEDLNDNSDEVGKLTNAEKLKDKFLLCDGAIITGKEKAGKTSLLRTLVLEYHYKGYAPVYLDMKDISRAVESDFQKELESAFAEQYQNKKADDWWRLPRNLRVIFLDDFDKAKVVDRFSWRLIDFSRKYAALVICTASDSFEMDELSSSELTRSVSGFKKLEIQSFGHKLRYKLIRKWNTIGESHSVSAELLISRFDAAEKILNSVLGKNLVPRVPIFLLTILQSIETSASANIANSAYGHYYGFLITEALNKVNVDKGELDEFNNYMSQLSWLFFSRESKSLGRHEIGKFSEVYSRDYARVDCDQRLGLLVRARLLDRRGESYSFCYPYIYYYFLGKYFADNVGHSAEVQAIVSRFAKHSYVEESANVLLFTIHHQKNDFVIDALISNTKELFSDRKPISLENDIQYINDLIDEATDLVFRDGDPDRARLEDREHQDNIEHSDEHSAAQQEPVKTGVSSIPDMDAELDLVSRINKLSKSVEILGQLLKSYYGSIKTERKAEIMKDIYDAPLRAINDCFNFISSNHDALIQEIEDLMKSKRIEEDSVRRKIEARKFVFSFFSMVSYGLIYKSGSATSSLNLRDTSRLLIEKEDSIGYRLISLASRLDMPNTLDFDEIDSLAKATKKNMLAYRLVRAIVLKHLYFFKIPDVDKQKVCAALDIAIQRQRSIDIKTKDQKLLTRR